MDELIILVEPKYIQLACKPIDWILGIKEPPPFKLAGVNVMNKPENLIVEMKFGSHLYGTQTEKSDEDYKGIFLPPVRDILLGRIPKTSHSVRTDDGRKNLPGELDAEYYSLHHFFKLAGQGQTVAIDMLFTPPKMTFKNEKYGWIWDKIVEKRSMFISQQMKSFVGYARGQAAKYSLKGERLNKLYSFKDMLSKALSQHIKWLDDSGDANLLSNQDALRLSDADWDGFPKDDERINANGIRELQIAGKWFGETTGVRTVLGSVQRLIDRYGNRAKSAADAEGVDWKALSHAVRVSKELMELLAHGEIRFPLAEVELLLKIKQGKVDLPVVQSILDRDLKFVELEMAKSRLPKNVDTKAIDAFLLDLLNVYISDEIVSVL